MSTNYRSERELEQRHYSFQLGMYFSGVEDLEEAKLYHSDLIEDAFWNYASQVSATRENLNQLLEKTEKVFHRIQRIPAFYLTPWTNPNELESELKLRGYERQFTDAWVVARGIPVPQIDRLPAGLEIIRVQTSTQIDAFVEVFMRAFGYVSKDVPYGGLSPSYGHALKRSLAGQRPDVTAVHYLALFEGKPVGTGSLLAADGIAGLYNLGVVPEYRKRGLGRILALRRISDAICSGTKVLFFQTEAEGLVEEMYSRLGFRREFIGVCWAKAKL